MTQTINGVKVIGGPFITQDPLGACFARDQRYRYTLWRRWSENCATSKMVAFVGLNPSTADESENDPTVTRCINFAKSWGYGGMVMLNLFAFRATDPKDMKANRFPEGSMNNAAILFIAASIGQVVTCWGVHGAYHDRGRYIIRKLREQVPTKLVHLGLTKEGHPRHPLYLRSDTSRQFWKAEAKQ